MAEEVEADEDLFPVAESLPDPMEINMTDGQNQDGASTDASAQKRLQDLKFSMLPVMSLPYLLS